MKEVEFSFSDVEVVESDGVDEYRVGVLLPAVESW